MNKIVLTGQPLSTNHIYKSHCKFGYPSYYMTPEGKSLKEQYQREAKTQWKSKPTIAPVSIYIDVYHGNKRKMDIDNFNKILFDSLTGIVWEDDSQVMELRISKKYDKEKPRIELLVQELN